MSLTAKRFDEFFRALYKDKTGDPIDPFPWQSRIANDLANNRWPDCIDLPTASGKTSLIDIAVFTLACEASKPVDKRTIGRRIFFTVNRRVIVDEAFDRSRDLARALINAEKERDLGILGDVARALRSINEQQAVDLLAEGLDPWWGLYHQPRHGRPALALDIMEPFRPVIVDSAVISAINTGMVQKSSFDNGSNGCILKPEGSKAFIRAYDARLDQLITHPIFDYRCSWRVVIRLQARLLARWFRGEIPQYTSITTR
jgi:hypothetical protein